MHQIISAVPFQVFMRFSGFGRKVIHQDQAGLFFVKQIRFCRHVAFCPKKK